MSITEGSNEKNDEEIPQHNLDAGSLGAGRATAAFAYLWFTGGSENEFYLSLLLPYILLVAYLFKEKKLGRVVE